MKERLALVFPYVLAVVLPLAGFLLAAARMAAHEREEAGYVFAASCVGVVLYLVVLSA
jgi:hypothetical protein